MEEKQIYILMKLARGYHVRRHKSHWFLVCPDFMVEEINRTDLNLLFEAGMLQPVTNTSWTLSPLGWDRAHAQASPYDLKLDI